MCKFWESNEKGNPKIRYLVEKIMLKYLKIPAFVYFFKDCLISAFTRCGCFCWYTHTVSCINISITTWTLQSVWLDNLGFRHQDLVTAWKYLVSFWIYLVAFWNILAAVLTCFFDGQYLQSNEAILLPWFMMFSSASAPNWSVTVPPCITPWRSWMWMF